MKIIFGYQLVWVENEHLAVTVIGAGPLALPSGVIPNMSIRYGRVNAHVDALRKIT